jgi:membrane protease YdiL (CAAX protease family)
MVVDRDVTWDVPVADMIEPPNEVNRAPEPPPFGAWRALKIFLAFLGIQIAVAVGVGLFAFFAGLHADLAGGAAPSELALTALEAAVAGTVLAGLVALAMVRRAFRRPGGDAVRAAVGWRGAPRRDVVRAALLGFGLVIVFAFASAWLPVRPNGLGPLARAANAGGLSRLLWALLAVIVAPPTEELLFRGVLFAGFARSWRPATAAALTTALFVALHVTELGGYWPAWIAIAALGALALRLRIAAGSLVPAIALHASYNLGLVLMVYAQPG